MFLDIDGVLNSRGYDRRRNWDEQTDIDETRLPLVRQIIAETGAQIVLISTWREHWSADKALCDEDGIYLDNTFAKYGLAISDKTPYLGLLAERRQEVSEWLAAHVGEVKSFAIVDDNKFGWAELAKFCVFTNPNFGKGLEEEHVPKVVKLLNSDILRG